MYQELTDLIYPKCCPVCMEILDDQKSVICPACYKKVKKVTQPYCYQCGKPLRNAEQEYCYDCEKKRHLFDRGFSLVEYDAVSSPSIMAVKYKNKREFIRFYRLLAKNNYGEFLRDKCFDAIIPVPISKSKRRKRGYNQARLFADGIASWLQVPVREDLLIRKRDTAPLKKLSPEERRKELLKVFEWKKEKNHDVRRVLLVDDIYTSGATADACTAVMKRNGVEEVILLTMAIGKGM